MFGYVVPEKPELKVREYELFRAYYCGVCKAIGSRTGQLPRLVLNYDCTFLALLLASVNGEKLEAARERCIAHPAAKRLVVKRSAAVEYASDINVILAYYKARDDWRDEKSAAGAAGTAALIRKFRKLRKRYGSLCDTIEEKLASLSKLEKEHCPSMDRAAEPFAALMEAIVAYKPFCRDDATEKVLRWIGYNMGRWIYLLDAWDDLEKDIRGKAYNPLVYQFGYSGEDLEAFKSSIRERVEFSLTYSLNQISKAYSLLELAQNQGIIENIIYLGMLRKTENTLKAGSCKKIEKSV